MNTTFALIKREGSLKRSNIFAALVVGLLALVVALSVCVHPSAAWAGNDGTDTNMRVNDYVGLLAEDKEDELSSKIKKLEPRLEFDIVVDISTKGGTKDYEKAFFEKNGFGFGKDSDGLILGYNPETKKCAIYRSGLGAIIFGDEYVKDLKKAFLASVEDDPARAVYDFLAESSIWAGIYQGVSVEAEWPDRNEGPALPATNTNTDAGDDNNGKTGTEGNDSGKTGAEGDDSGKTGTEGKADTGTEVVKHTTAELDWYPKDPASFKEFHNPDAPRVVDNADLLTDEEEAALLEKIKDMESRLDMDFVLYTDMSSYGLSRGLFAADFFAFNGYGRGDDYTGVVYFVCMEPGNRGFWTAACGSAKALMTEDNVNHMDDETYDHFRSGDYAKAINIQFENLDVLYTNGKFPFNWLPIIAGIVFSLIVAFAFALIKASMELKGLKKQMETVNVARTAREYASSPFFSVRTDTHTGHTVTRTKHVTYDSDSGGSSGGSSSYSSDYHSSGGSSHSFSGGGRSF